MLEMVLTSLGKSCFIEVIVEILFVILRQTAEKCPVFPHALQQACLAAQFVPLLQSPLPQPTQHMTLFAPWAILK